MQSIARGDIAIFNDYVDGLNKDGIVTDYLVQLEQPI